MQTKPFFFHARPRLSVNANLKKSSFAETFRPIGMPFATQRLIAIGLEEELQASV
jgi:hypothetical protein